MHAMRVYHDNACFGKSKREDIWNMGLSKTSASAIQTQQGTRHLGKIEILPNAIHTIVTQAVSQCYGVVGIAAPRLRNGQAVVLPDAQNNQGVQVRVIHDQIIIEVYVALEYGLRISEIAHNIMSQVKFSVEKMLGIPVAQVNVNVQGLSHSPTSPISPASSPSTKKIRQDKTKIK